MKVLTLSSLILSCQCLDIGSLVTQAEKEVTSERQRRVRLSSGHSRGKKVTKFSSMMSDRNEIVRRTFDRFLKVDFEFLRCESILSGGPASNESVNQVTNLESLPKYRLSHLLTFCFRVRISQIPTITM